MSQQSNPATLREALSELRCVADNLYMNLKAAAQFNPEGFNTPALEQVFQRFKTAAAKSVEIEAALAASGTEAAPDTQVKMRLVCRYCGHEAQEGEWVGVHGCSKCNPSTIWGAAQPMNIPLGVPSQAAASPEGEGRETRLMETMDAKRWAEEFMRIFSERKQDIDEGLMLSWFASAIMTGHDFALRQSAAPSGGAALWNAAKER